MTIMTYLIVRRKNDPTAPRITSTPETVDLDLFDVLDEHGNLVSEEVLAEIRKMQAPPEPPPEKHQPAHRAHQPLHQPPHEPHPPQHEPQHQATAPKKSNR